MERLREAAYTLNRRNKGSGKLSVTFAVFFTKVSVPGEYIKTMGLDSMSPGGDPKAPRLI